MVSVVWSEYRCGEKMVSVVYMSAGVGMGWGV